MNELKLAQLENGDGREQTAALFFRNEGQLTPREIRRLATEDGIPAEDILAGNLAYALCDILGDTKRCVTLAEKMMFVQVMVKNLEKELNNAVEQYFRS